MKNLESSLVWKDYNQLKLSGHLVHLLCRIIYKLFLVTSVEMLRKLQKMMSKVTNLNVC